MKAICCSLKRDFRIGILCASYRACYGEILTFAGSVSGQQVRPVVHRGDGFQSRWVVAQKTL